MMKFHNSSTYSLWISMSFLTLVFHAPSILGDFEVSHSIKTFLEPCDTVYTQVHCDDDDEDYETMAEDCAPIKTDDCDRSLQLYCHSGVCLPNCHPTLEEYDSNRGKCFRKIGANCSRNEECDHDQHALCERRHCRCEKNYTLEPESGKCVRSAEFGEFCDSEVICDMLGDMLCINSTCQCRDEQSQFFHPKRKRCYVRLGQDCTNKHRSFQFCPDNSDCIRLTESGEIEQYIGIPEDNTNGKNFICSCNNGYAPTKDGNACLGIYGTSCSSLNKCNTERSFKCYSGGTCSCARPKDQVFYDKLQRCVTLIGSLCEEERDTCVEWAACNPDADKGISICECLSGFSSSGSTDMNACLKDHGQNCASTGKLDSDEDEQRCNEFVGLECSNHTGTCQCQDSNQFYDVRLKNCRNFEVAQRRIPVTHYDTSDREYNFHLNSNNALAVTQGMTLMCHAIIVLYILLGL